MAGWDDIRAVALALPGVREEADGLGEAAFRVGRKGFVQTWRGRVVMKLDRWRQELLFEARPEVFSPMNAGALRWSWVEIEALEAGEIAELVTEAWAQVVPKKVSRAHDSLFPLMGEVARRAEEGLRQGPVTPSVASRQLPHEGEQS